MNNTSIGKKSERSPHEKIHQQYDIIDKLHKRIHEQHELIKNISNIQLAKNNITGEQKGTKSTVNDTGCVLI
jgi:hypothetical protein